MAKHSKRKKRPPEGSPDQPNTHLTATPEVNWKLLLRALAIVLAGLWIYWPVLHGDWLWDDNLYLTENPLLNDPARLWKIWFVPGSLVEYYPITESFQWAQWQLFDNNTFGYHLTNIILHIFSALLVWRLLSKFGLRLAWLGGLIFAIHPMQVESVAWISELKNALSMPPFLLAMCAYIDYEENKKNRDYWLSLGFFLMAMLCKNSMALFPVVILLYAWWKRGRIGMSDLKASVPFFIISVTLAMITAWAGSRFIEIHNPSTPAPAPMVGFFSQAALAGFTISFYFSKCFWPMGLLPIYPPWIVNHPSLIQFLPWPIFGAGIYWLWSKRQSWGRHALLGLGFFLLSLVPILGLIMVRYTTLVWSLDHLAYIPLLGLIGLTVASLGQIQEQLPKFTRPYGIAIVAVATTLLLFTSHGYANAFVNSEALWTYTLQHGSESWEVRKNLGEALVQNGKFSAAMEQYELALRGDPDLVVVHNNMGEALLKASRYSEAANEFEQVLRIMPDSAIAHFNLGCCLQQMSQMPEAIDQYRQAIQINSFYSDAHHKLGDLLLQTGQPPEAMDEYEKAVKLAPGDFEAHNNLGSILFKAGRFDEAIEHFAASLKINPNDAITHNNMGICLAKMERIPEAVAQFEAALKIKPDFINAQNNLAQMQEILANNPASN
jgi:protein O-mannosyl-transferase